MRQYKRPYFQTKQYWGLVEILKNGEIIRYTPTENNPNRDKEIAITLTLTQINNYLKADNPKFKKELFLKALNGGK